MAVKNGLTRASKWIVILLGIIALCTVLTSAGMAWGHSISAQKQAEINAEDIQNIEVQLSAIDTKLDFIIEALKNE